MTDKNSTGNSIAAGPTSGLVRSAHVDANANRPAYEGKIDPNGNVRLKLGVIDNPTVQRTKDTQLDPIDPMHIVNLDNGKVMIKWIEQNGGIIRTMGNNGYGKDGEDSDREPIKLTHPFLWANDSNWCGINYMPPVGSIVVVGFRKHNEPVILGYMQSHYEVVDKVELGEMMNKGIGNNSSYWKMNDEQEHKAWVTQGESRPIEHLKNVDGRKYKWQPAPYTVGLKLRLKAWIDPFNPSDKKEMIEMYAYKIKDGIMQQHSMVEVRPEMVHIWSESPIIEKVRSECIVVPSSLTNKSSKLDSPAASTGVWTPDGIVLNSSGTIKMNAGKIYLN